MSIVFIVGIAKLSIYITRRNKIEQKGEQELISFYKNGKITTCNLV